MSEEKAAFIALQAYRDAMEIGGSMLDVAKAAMHFACDPTRRARYEQVWKILNMEE